jgi:pimeloyl-ACP methyl ester carboxylesterase
MKPAFMNRFWNWLKRALLWTSVIIFVLAATGIIYQTAATETDRKNFPAPGNLIDVGGFKMHIYCMGEGSPTVVLEALSGGFSSFWGWVQPEVAKQVRVCAYDRAGLGWSEADPQPESLQRTAQNLHTLLKNAGITGPYVMVGHSIGGLYVREYAAMYPQEVAGMVLLDSSHPDQFARYPEMFRKDPTLTYMPLIQGFVRFGIGHALFAIGGGKKVSRNSLGGLLPLRQHNEVASIFLTQEYWRNQKVHLLVENEIFQQAHDLGSLRDLPLAVITRGIDVPQNWSDMQDELAALSTNSIHLTVENSTHSSLVFNSDHARVVSQIILEVINAVRTGKRLNDES